MQIGNRNVFLWFHCSPEAISAISELLQEKLIEFEDTLPLLYHADGSIPRYPVGKRSGRYKTAHWWPAGIIRGAKFVR